MTGQPVYEGFVTVWRGQPYHLIALDDYVRKDGKPSKILTWRSRCPNCGADFVQQSGRPLTHPNRRCPECKAPGRKVG